MTRYGTTEASPQPERAPTLADVYAGRWVMSMRWHDLLFMHWPVPVAMLRPLVPPGLEVETYDGDAWVGVVPFRMSGVRPRFVPPVPGTSAFPELNVRTYVTRDGKPGVWFFSLDAANRLAVRGARWLFHLNYLDADMACGPTPDGGVRYRSVRTHTGAPPAELRMSYRPTGEVYMTRPGELDHFLTNRLCLYAADRKGRIYRADIAHLPWPLQPAEAEVEVNTMASASGITLPDAKPLLHFARFLEVPAWWRVRVR